MMRIALAAALLSCCVPVSRGDGGAADTGYYADDGGMLSSAAFIQDAGPSVGTALVKALVSEPPNIDEDFVGFLRASHTLVLNKEWGKLVFFVVTLLVWLIRRYLGPRWPILTSGVAAIIQAFLLAFTGALATTWGAGITPTAADVFTALNIGFAAAGGWSILKALLEAASTKWAWAKAVYEVMVPPTPPDTVVRVGPSL